MGMKKFIGFYYFESELHRNLTLFADDSWLNQLSKEEFDDVFPEIVHLLPLVWLADNPKYLYHLAAWARCPSSQFDGSIQRIPLFKIKEIPNLQKVLQRSVAAKTIRLADLIYCEAWNMIESYSAANSFDREICLVPTQHLSRTFFTEEWFRPHLRFIPSLFLVEMDFGNLFREDLSNLGYRELLSTLRKEFKGKVEIGPNVRKVILQTIPTLPFKKLKKLGIMLSDRVRENKIDEN